MAYTSDDLRTIQEAKASGCRSLQFSDGRRIERFTMAELSQIESDIKIELAGNSPKPVVRRIQISTTKGF